MLIGAGNAGLSSGLQILQVGAGHQRIFAAFFAIAGIACTASHPATRVTLARGKGASLKPIQRAPCGKRSREKSDPSLVNCSAPLG